MGGKGCRVGGGGWLRGDVGVGRRGGRRASSMRLMRGESFEIWGEEWWRRKLGLLGRAGSKGRRASDVDSSAR